jgi:ABC-type multidrug transport system ATPase subunit
MDLLSNQKFEEIMLVDVYLQYPKKSIVKGINLGISSGSSFGLIGHNASGKSTILKLITAQIAKTSGSILFSGR